MYIDIYIYMFISELICRLLCIYIFIYTQYVRRPEQMEEIADAQLPVPFHKKFLKDGPFQNGGFTGVATAIYVHTEFTGLNPNGSHFLSHDQHR